ncbi:RagB/SusD family nutrient uptake outer membrane protein [Pseudobacter ginsenosidimutans]|uniref:Putative outer membrane starch-binding protein n=1 Tax=Pseudobacter ginsenosidimutans TaxID=661488 RepID=A0A4Q7N4G6_9BACT|nr:RagB/SusD family nutrient uptake outer membrane protein [Pseudobacter ginsenosidimutans]QEC44432.1 RagB/SusD family nutrient uptake outer membrane protein [Pseudobacter ginsenosidimutans]RZS75903.1 putative outer membrane starch-binding protein [Pseudobacter ginsenosidimutans]
MRKQTFIHTICILISASVLVSSCKKLLETEPPISSISTEEMFSNNQQAELAIAGIYSKMINGIDMVSTSGITNTCFAAGLTTITAGLSSDELMITGNNIADDLALSQNKILPSNTRRTDAIWNSAFRTAYDATAVIDGIAASTSEELVESVRNQLTGEALAIRAFSYFYLVNSFGDVPLVLSSDSKKNVALPRAPVSKIYEQIIADLVKARSLLSSDFAFAKNEKVRVSKWFAEALLARVYLYTGQYQSAISSATEVINQKALFDLEPDLGKVFLKQSKEAIFQLKQTSENAYQKLGTPEGLAFLYNANTAGTPPYIVLSDQLLGSFEANDQRRTSWVASYPPYLAPAKYKNGEGLEYYIVMRLAELYLIRAEATVLGSPANVNAAIADINQLRKRANVTELELDLPAATVIDAIAHERKIELFAEWGHRWFDLKRTGKAHDTLSAIPNKQPWWGDFQLLYPIPEKEINVNGQLIQNPEYNTL